jgi:2-dehydro-3-deoxy-D-arabinonate dehydratase
MSSRDIEGENPLYLPQAKVYERSAAIGPCLHVPENPISAETTITILIKRGQKEIFRDNIQLNRMKRNFNELSEYLFRGCIFKNGVYLMTGTGMVPPAQFTLEPADEIYITIEGIGTLFNIVAIMPILLT